MEDTSPLPPVTEMKPRLRSCSGDVIWSVLLRAVTDVHVMFCACTHSTVHVWIKALVGAGENIPDVCGYCM